MSTETNLKQAIIESARDLFMKQGYTATSIKQIANAAGCKTSSMYYYFEGGKSDILGAVIQSLTFDVQQFLDDQEFETLEDFLHYYAGTLNDIMSMNRRISWLVPEFKKLSETEMNHIQKQFLNMHDAFEQRLKPLVSDTAAANELAWIITCAQLGYGNLFFAIGLGNRVDFSPTDFGHSLARFLGEK